MKKLFTLFSLTLFTFAISAQVLWESGFETSDGYAANGATTITGQKDWVDNGLTTDGFWNLWYSEADAAGKTYSVTTDGSSNSGSQALKLEVTSTTGASRIRSNKQATLTPGDVYKVSYWAKTDARGAALSGGLLNFTHKTDGPWIQLTQNYQQYVEYYTLQSNQQFWIYIKDHSANYTIWIDDLKIEKAVGADFSQGLPITDGFEGGDGYGNGFSISAQNLWTSQNPGTIWKDLYSNADASDKTYVSSIIEDSRTGSSGSQCMKFEINDGAFDPKTVGNTPTVKLRSYAFDNVVANQNYVIKCWARTPDASGEASISAMNGNFQTITDTWTEYVLPYTALSSQLVQIFFNDIDKDFTVLIDDITIEVDNSTAISGGVISENIQIYPNPVASQLFVKSSDSISKIEVYNLSGQKVLESTSINNGVSVAHLPNGIYIASIEVNGEKVIKKFTKK